MPTAYTITVTASSVTSVSCKPGDTVQWYNNSGSTIVISNLPNILSPTPPGESITLADKTYSSTYTVNGSKGSYTYEMSLAEPDNLPATGTISID